MDEEREQRRVPLPSVTLKGLLHHAETFGVDGVAEVAARAGMTEEQLTELIETLDRINAAIRRDPKRKKLFWTRPTKVPADAGRHARWLLGIPEPEDLAKPSRKKPAAKGKIARPRKEGHGRANPKTGGGARRGS